MTINLVVLEMPTDCRFYTMPGGIELQASGAHIGFTTDHIEILKTLVSQLEELKGKNDGT